MKLLFKYWKKSRKGVNAFILCSVLRIPVQIINTMMVLWIADAMESATTDPFIPVTLVVLGCLLATLLGLPITFYTKMGRIYVFTDLSKDIEHKVLFGEYKMFTKYPCNKIASLYDSMWRIGACGSMIQGIFTSVITLVATCFGIGKINPLFLIPVALVYAVGISIFYQVFKKMLVYDEQADKESVKRNAEFHNIIDGFVEVRAFCKEQEHTISMSRQNKKVLHLRKQKMLHSMKMDASIEGTDGILTIAGVIFSVLAIREGWITSTFAITLIMYVWRLISPMVNVVSTLDELSYNLGLLPEFDAFMNYENEIEDGRVDLVGFHNQIKFSNVSFAYNDSDTVINDASFTIRKGEKIGICGLSGGGKSTLLKLLPRFYDPSEGSIYIDGIDLKLLTLKSLRQKIGIVSQETFIFAGTISANIGYAKSGATEYEIAEAAKKAYLYDFITSLPDGFETEVGPRGLKLSGGQKQRIALARIFLLDPEIVLLDEATSALDNESESIVQKSLELLQGKTIISVAHRLTTIQDSDKIIVLNDHKIAEMGSHEELMKKGGIYSTLQK